MALNFSAIRQKEKLQPAVWLARSFIDFSLLSFYSNIVIFVCLPAKQAVLCFCSPVVAVVGFLV